MMTSMTREIYRHYKRIGILVSIPYSIYDDQKQYILDVIDKTFEHFNIPIIVAAVDIEKILNHLYLNFSHLFGCAIEVREFYMRPWKHYNAVTMCIE